MSKNSILIFVLVGLVVFLFIVSKINSANLATNKTNTKTTTVTPQNPVYDRAIDINDVVTDPAVYKDLNLTLEGKINDWVTKNTFSFTPVKSSFTNSGKTLPVINRNNFRLPQDTPEKELALGEVANIKVTGRIVIFDRASIEAQWKIDLDDKLVDKWNKTPVILAENIEKL